MTETVLIVGVIALACVTLAAIALGRPWSFSVNKDGMHGETKKDE